MALTLGFLASVIILLPGLVALATFNFRVGRAGARRPEQQLTAVSSLVAAVIVSILTHYIGYLVAECVIDAGISIYEAWGFALGPVLPNPVSAFYVAVAGGPAMAGPTAIASAALLAFEVFAILGFVSSETFDLMVERLDWSGQGWVFQHITSLRKTGLRPSAMYSRPR